MTRKSIETLFLITGCICYLVFAIYLPSSQRHDNDFKHIYLGMKALLEGDEPYSAKSLLYHASRNGLYGHSLNPYVYPPFTGLCLGFLQPLNFWQASTVWFVLNHFMTVAALWMMAQSMWKEHRAGAFGVLLAAIAFNYPMVRTLTAGQLNLVLLLCLTGSYALLLSGKHRSAGGLLGFAAMFKLLPGIYGLYFILRRRWVSLWSMTITCAALFALSLAAFGWKVHLLFLPMLRQMSYGRSTWEEHRATFWKDPSNQAVNSLMTHLLTGDDAVTPWIKSSQNVANAATWAVSLILLTTWLITTIRKKQSASDRTLFSVSEQATFHATLLLSLLLPSLMWDHYLVLCILPLCWLVRYCMSGRRWGQLLLVAACYFVTCLPWQYDKLGFRQGAGLLLMSLKLYPVLVLFSLCCLAAIQTEGRPVQD